MKKSFICGIIGFFDGESCQNLKRSQALQLSVRYLVIVTVHVLDAESILEILFSAWSNISIYSNRFSLDSVVYPKLMRVPSPINSTNGFTLVSRFIVVDYLGLPSVSTKGNKRWSIYGVVTFLTLSKRIPLRIVPQIILRTVGRN